MASKGTLVVRFIGDLKEFGKSFEKAGSQISDFSKYAGAAGGAALTAGFLESMGLEKANDKLAAQLGLTEKESERVGKVASNLYAGAWGDNMDQVNTAVGAVMSSIDGMGKASSKRLQGLTATALDFAGAFDVDVQRAVSVAGTVINSGLAKNGTQAFDLLTTSAQRVPANLREGVLDAAEEYGQFFNSLGLRGPEAFGLLVQGAQKGQFGLDKVGDAVKEFTIRATDLSSGTKDAFGAMGMNSEKMTNKLLAGGGKANKAFGQIVGGLRRIKDPGKQAEAAIALFGTPLEDLGTDKIPQFLKSLQGGGKAMKGFKGSAQDMGDTLNDNASTTLTEFGRTMRTEFVELVGGKAIPFVEKWSGVLMPLAGTLAAVAGVLAAVSVATWGVTTAITAWTAITKVATAVSIVFKNIQFALNLVMMTNPIALVVVALVALVAGLVIAYKKSDKFRAIVNKAFGAVKGFVLGVIDWFRSAVPAAIKWVSNKWTAGWNGLKKGTVKVATAVVNFVKKLPKLLVKFFLNWTLPGLIIKHWDSIKSGTIKVATSIVNWVKGLPGRLVAALRSLGSKLLSVARTGFGKLRDGATEKITGLLSWLGDLPGRIADKVGDLGGVLVDKGKSVISGLWEGISSMGGWLKDKLISFVADKIPGPIAKALGINSPSKVMRDLAVWIPRGMAMGIDDESRQVARSAERMAAMAVPRVTGPHGAGIVGTGGMGRTSVSAPIQVNLPTTATPEAAADAAGGRIARHLEALGM